MVTFSGSLLAPFSATKGAECFIIREARRDDLKTIGWVAAEAFIHDAIAHYFSGTTKPMSVIDKADLRALYDLYYFVVKACMIGGGRVVVAVPTVEGSSGSKAATTIAAAGWHFKVFKKLGIKRIEGLMSILMREGFAYAHSVTPGIPVTLDATSSRARDRYMHLGYELMEPRTLIGVGKATSLGIAPSKNNPGYGSELTGVPYWCMVNVSFGSLLVFHDIFETKLACTVGASELVARERGRYFS
ncbi:hypothetical protein GG344DRAFT_81425 [Lentinula edodes]|nr:hypothetical protein GG344DRAFT_81425 [Lentinula edodes]